MNGFREAYQKRNEDMRTKDVEKGCHADMITWKLLSLNQFNLIHRTKGREISFLAKEQPGEF